jgi:hypothetical protein
MNVVRTQFYACRPMAWNGRYGRMMGDKAVFHLRHVDGRLWPYSFGQPPLGLLPVAQSTVPQL